jgi:phytoene synthase
MESAALQTANRQVIAKGSKSFFLAGLILKPEIQHDAFALYRWCRFVDDQIDACEDPTEALSRLTEIQRLTELACRVTTSSQRLNPSHPSDTTQIAVTSMESAEAPFQPLWKHTHWHPKDATKSDEALFLPEEYVSLRDVVKKYNIPAYYPLQLLEGMRMDCEKTVYLSESQLDLYCYRVAGVVGLMMAHILGVRHERALKHACDMGMAMQLTNIARDVREDALRRRVYLPEDVLRKHGLTAQVVLNTLGGQGQSAVIDNELSHKIFLAVEHLLRRAESYYQSGDAGVKYLSWRQGWAIRCARLVYSEIGRMLLRTGPAALTFRVITSKPKKVFLALRALILQLETFTWMGFERASITTLIPQPEPAPSDVDPL